MMERSAWMLALVAVCAIAALAAVAAAQTDPPSSGDWTVADATVVEDRTVDLRGDLMVSASGELTLRNVTLRVYSVSSTDLRGIAVLPGGRLTLTDRDGNRSTTLDRTIITRGVASWPFSFTVAKGATLVVRNSAIAGAGAQGAPGGVVVQADDALLEGTTFSSGNEFDLELNGCANASVLNCTFGLSDRVGLRLVSAHGAVVRGCRIVGNQGGGLEAYGCQDMLVDACNISSNGLTGVLVRMGANVTLRDCLLGGNSDGLVAQTTLGMRLERLVVSLPSFYGIRLIELCDGAVLDGCNVTGAARDGIQVDAARNLTVRDTLVATSAHNGVWVGNYSQNVTFDGCHVEDNSYTGIKVETSSLVRLVNDTIERNGYHGAWVINTADLGVAGGILRDNGYNGLYGDNVLNITADRLRAEGNGYSGVELATNCRQSVLRSCTLASNDLAGLWLSLVRDILFEECKLTGNAFYGARVEGRSIGIRLVGCDISGNAEVGLSVVRDSYDIVVEGSALAATSPAVLAIVDTGATLQVLNSSMQGRVQAKGGAGCLIVSPRGGWPPVTVQEVGSYLDQGWWLSVEVVWPTGDPVAGASVNATSTGGNRAANATTGADGWARWMPVVQQTNTFDGIVGRNPWTVRASLGVNANATDVTVDRDMTIRIVLRDVEAPVARAADVVAELGATTVLNGSASTDNIAITSFLWSFHDGVGSVELFGRFAEWRFMRLGTFQATLEVADAAGLLSSVEFNITVVDTTPPVVVAGADATIPQLGAVALDGTASTDNDATLLLTGRFEWRVADLTRGTSADGPTAAVGSIRFPEMGLFRVTLRVTDQSGNWAEGGFNLTVLDTIDPVVRIDWPSEVDEDVEVTIGPAAVDDSDPAFNATGRVWWVVGDVEVEGTVLVWTFTTPGAAEVVFHAIDAAGNSATSTGRFHVRDRTPPSLPQAWERTVELREGIVLDAQGITDNDPDFPAGADISWSVEGPRLPQPIHGRPPFQVFVPWVGDYIATLTVTDASNNTATLVCGLHSVDTTAPAFASFMPGPDALQPSTRVELVIDATDPGTGVMSVEVRTWPAGSVAWGEWAEVTIVEGELAITARATVDLAEGTNRVQVRLRDLADNEATSPEHIVRVNSRPVARILTPSENATFGPYDSVVLDGSASRDPDANDTLRYTWSSDIDGPLGDGMRVTVDRLQPGRHRITLEVTDGITGHTAVATVNVTVESVPGPGHGEVPAWVWFVAVLLVVAASLLLVRELVLKGRRPEAPPPPPEARARVDEGWAEEPPGG